MNKRQAKKWRKKKHNNFIKNKIIFLGNGRILNKDKLANMLSSGKHIIDIPPADTSHPAQSIFNGK